MFCIYILMKFDFGYVTSVNQCQNSGLIHQLSALDSGGGQRNPCLPLTIICHHFKPVSQQKSRHFLQLKY